MSATPASPLPPKEDLLESTHAARGCLFLSGCGGSFVLLALVFLVALQTAGFLESWVTGEPFRMPHVDLRPSPLAWAWLILSWVGYRGMQNRIQSPWVYWITVVSLAGWCWFAFTNPCSISVGDKHIADEYHVGSWIAAVVTGIVLLRFALNRRNLAYFRVIASLKHTPSPPP